MHSLTQWTFARAFALAMTISSLLVATVHAQSLPETVMRLDGEVKALRLAVDDLTKRLAIQNASNAAQASAIGYSAVFQKGSLEQATLAATGASEITPDYRRIVDVLATHCTFKAVALRVEGKAIEFSNVARVGFPPSESVLLAAEFEGFVECDARDLFLRLLKSEGVMPPTAAPRPATETFKVPCSGGLIVNRKEPGVDGIQWIVPFVSPTIVRADTRSIADGHWSCTARRISEPDNKARRP